MFFQEILQRIAAPAAGLLLIVSLLCWGLTSSSFQNRPPKLAAGIPLPYIGLLAGATDMGIHFVAIHRPATPPLNLIAPTISFDHIDGYGVNLLGVVATVMPDADNQVCYYVPAHVAFIVPYWLLVGASVYWLGVTTSFGSWLATQWSGLSPVAIGFGIAVLVVFLVLNAVPPFWRSGYSYNPYGGWIILAQVESLRQQIVNSEMDFGFPSRFHRSAYGWHHHKIGENLCIAIVAAFALAMAVEWRRKLLLGSETSVASSEIGKRVEAKEEMPEHA